MKLSILLRLGALSVLGAWFGCNAIIGPELEEPDVVVEVVASCSAAVECDDDNPCTADACEGGVCQHANDDDVVADDGQDCTDDARVDGTARALAQDDIEDKGPYAKRPFARIVGAAVPQNVGVAPPIPADPPLQFEKDESNELIVLLNYASQDRLQTLLPNLGLTSGSTPAQVERAFITVLNEKSLIGSLVLGQPAHARFMINDERMSDEMREKSAAAKQPQERLDRYIVLRYGTVALARAAAETMRRDPAIAFVTNNSKVRTSWVPNDPYCAPLPGSPKPQYQWGLYAMNFPTAWDTVLGNAYIAVLDAGYPGNAAGSTNLVVHPDLTANYRPQMSPGTLWGPNDPAASTSEHTTHVSGIIAAKANNGFFLPFPLMPSQSGEVAGGCVFCSFATFTFLNNTVFAPYPTAPYPTVESYAAVLSAQVSAFKRAVAMGMQVLNWSGSTNDYFDCPGPHPMCEALELAKVGSMLTVIATGNVRNVTPLSPTNLAPKYPILPVAATEIFAPGPGVPNSLWYGGKLMSGPEEWGSVDATADGVVAPGKNIVSTIRANSTYITGDIAAIFQCGDSAGLDASGARYTNGYGDAVGTCTGTSMAAPHVSALAGLILSINPRLSATDVRQIIRQSGNLAATPTSALGAGLPNAAMAVAAAVGTNPSKLTPLFSFYSTSRSDSFYTTVPQMANAALDGTLRPKKEDGAAPSFGNYNSAYGTALGTYWTFPRSPFNSGLGSQPMAEVWIFTTHVNPKNAAVPLEPLYRFSWKCGDSTPYPPAICAPGDHPGHVDTSYGLSSEISYLNWLGYKVDGIEGYIYPKSAPQPAGSVKLMRKYNQFKDDVAIFPDTKFWNMFVNHMYTNDVNGTDWLGYVYPNTNGSVPVIQ